MKTYRHEFAVNSEIERVWDFFTDIKHFEMISPKNLNEVLLKASNTRLTEGTNVWLSTDLFVKRTWHSKIIKSEPYEYVDEIREGLFKRWTHTHRFTRITDSQTSVMDEIAFELPYGLIGRILELIILNKLESIFKQREIKAREVLENQ